MRSSEGIAVIETNSKAVQVTLFEDRAEVCREATLSLSAGAHWIKVKGVSLFVDDRSVQVKPPNEKVEILGARVLRRMIYQEELGHEERQALEKKREEQLQKHRELSLSKHRVQQRRQHAKTLSQMWSQSVQRNIKIEQPDDTSKESFLLLQEESFAALAEEQQLEDELRAANEAILWLNALLQQAAQKKPIYESAIEVQLRAEVPQENIVLSLVYVTPAALWRPEHLARLTTEAEDKGEITLTTFATCWQRTGEEWSDVEVLFSTARPAREATPPLLQTDLLSLRKKTEEEKANIAIEVREQKIQSLSPASGVNAPPEFPGVDDGGQPLLYRASQRVSLVSDGQPFQVEIARIKLPCAVSRVLLPERASVAYLKATATYSGAHPLLAGPVQLAREAGFVGKMLLDFVGVGDSLSLGFGADDAVRVRRQIKEKRETTPIIGTQLIQKTVELWVSNLSGASKKVELTERIPVSELEDIEILLTSEGVQRDKDGFCKKLMVLSPFGVEKFSFSYEVRAGAKVRLPDWTRPHSRADELDF
jgi:uncharacterized protein (TIGR02231 family)